MEERFMMSWLIDSEVRAFPRSRVRNPEPDQPFVVSSRFRATAMAEFRVLPILLVI